MDESETAARYKVIELPVSELPKFSHLDDLRRWKKEPTFRVVAKGEVPVSGVVNSVGDIFDYKGKPLFREGVGGDNPRLIHGTEILTPEQSAVHELMMLDGEPLYSILLDIWQDNAGAEVRHGDRVVHSGIHYVGYLTVLNGTWLYDYEQERGKAFVRHGDKDIGGPFQEIDLPVMAHEDTWFYVAHLYGDLTRVVLGDRVLYEGTMSICLRSAISLKHGSEPVFFLRKRLGLRSDYALFQGDVEIAYFRDWDEAFERYDSEGITIRLCRSPWTEKTGFTVQRKIKITL